MAGIATTTRTTTSAGSGCRSHRPWMSTADPLPQNVRDVLAIAPEKRSPAQTAAVFSYWRTTVPEWKEANARIDRALAAASRRVPRNWCLPSATGGVRPTCFSGATFSSRPTRSSRACPRS